MKLSQARAAYEEFSGKLSDISRQLCFAGIAVVWIVRRGNEQGIVYDSFLIYPLAFFVGSLAFDLLHYIFSTFIWGFFSRHQKNKGKKPDDEVSPSKLLNWPSIFCLWIKVSLNILGYILLFGFLYEKI